MEAFMKTIDYSFLENITFSSDIMDSLSNIDINRTLSSLFQFEYPDLFVKLTPDSIIDSIFSSNQLEGIYATSSVIRNMQKGFLPKNNTEKLVKGYIETRNYIFANYAKIEISEYSIYQIYKFLNSYFDDFEGFKYRSSEANIMKVNNVGNLEIILQTAIPNQIAFQISNLIEQYNFNKSKASISQLFLIPCFIHDFLCIWPYPNYNSTLSRLLTQLLLLKSGFDILKYSSWDYEIYSNDVEYFNSLREPSISNNEDENSYLPFIKYFLNTLNTLYSKVAYRYRILKVSSSKKSSRIRDTIMYASRYITKEDIHTLWPDIAYNTIELELSSLLKQKLISKSGTTNGVSYIWLGEKKELKTFPSDI